MAEGKSGEDFLGVVGLSVMVGLCFLLWMGGKAVWQEVAGSDRIKETVLVTCRQGTETVFVGVAKGEPERGKGSIRIAQDDGNITVLDDSAHCVTSTVRRKPLTTADMPVSESQK